MANLTTMVHRVKSINIEPVQLNGFTATTIRFDLEDGSVFEVSAMADEFPYIETMPYRDSQTVPV
jgi:hypothetical protein